MRLSAHPNITKAARFSSDGRLIVSCGNDQAVILWDASTGERLLAIRGSQAELSPDSRWLVTWNRGRLQFWEVATGILAGEKVDKFDSVGEKFDPRFHEALLRTETDDHPPDTVIRVMRAGYKLGDDVLRPALVEVAAASASAAPEEPEDGDSAEE